MMVMRSTVAAEAVCLTCERALVGICRSLYKLTKRKSFTIMLLVPGALPEMFVVCIAFAGERTNV